MRGGAGADSESEPVTPDDSDAQETAQTEDADDEPTASDTATASPTTTTTAAPTTTTTELPTTTTTRPPATTQPPTTRPPATTAPPTTRAPATTTTAPPTTTTTQAPSQALWTATLTVGEPTYEVNWGQGQHSHLGFDASVPPNSRLVKAAGTLDPATYEYEPGRATAISRLTADGGGMVLRTSEGHDGLQGLWLKLSDDVALPIESYVDQGVRQWSFSAENTLRWSAGDEVEISLWDRDPIPRPQPLWTATLTAQDINDEHFRRGRGYADGVAGSLDPIEFEYEPGKTTRITRLVTRGEGAQIGAKDPEALNGLWVDFGEGIFGRWILPVDSARRSDGLFHFDEAVLNNCSMPWSSGETVEVSLWDRDPMLVKQTVWDNTEGQGESEGRGEPRRVPDNEDRVPRC